MLFARKSSILALASAIPSAIALQNPSTPDLGIYNSVAAQAKNPNSPNGLTVDLGYNIYEGVSTAYEGTNYKTWQGIRYAEPPIGSLRWQSPQVPHVNRSAVMPANEFPAQCPQSASSPYPGEACPGLATAKTLPASCYDSSYFQQQIKGSEDCLFLNVYSPENATNLPVYVYIHGGGYGQGNGQADMINLIHATGSDFVGVVIQYRLGAFGFLSSDDVFKYGTVNAGIQDQTLALKWVQTYIKKFGGDPNRVTIGGESAGGGSVMLQNMIFNGTIGHALFNNSIYDSPYLPQQQAYDAPMSTTAYHAFASEVGCFNGTDTGASVFDCLVGKNTYVLQQASSITSGSVRYGQYAFLPVTDGLFIAELPSQQYKARNLNGARVLVGNNANEGALFVPQNLTTEADFVNFVQTLFPHFTAAQINEVLNYYPSTNASVNAAAPDFATNGLNPPTALNQSSFGTGQQQRANNLYAEVTFVCPAYWANKAFGSTPDKISFKYQFSVPPAYHSADLTPFFGQTGPLYTAAFASSAANAWGNFIKFNSPSISNYLANGATGNQSANPASNWPLYTPQSPYMINLNVTGGTPSTESMVLDGKTIVYPVSIEPNLGQALTKVNAYTWEADRGRRCDFWQNIGPSIPE